MCNRHTHSGSSSMHICILYGNCNVIKVCLNRYIWGVGKQYSLWFILSDFKRRRLPAVKYECYAECMLRQCTHGHTIVMKNHTCMGLQKAFPYKYLNEYMPIVDVKLWYILSRASKAGSPKKRPWLQVATRHGLLTLDPCLVATQSQGGSSETPPRWHGTIYVCVYIYIYIWRPHLPPLTILSTFDNHHLL